MRSLSVATNKLKEVMAIANNGRKGAALLQRILNDLNADGTGEYLNAQATIVDREDGKVTIRFEIAPDGEMASHWYAEDVRLSVSSGRLLDVLDYRTITKGETVVIKARDIHKFRAGDTPAVFTIKTM